MAELKIDLEQVRRHADTLTRCAADGSPFQDKLSDTFLTLIQEIERLKAESDNQMIVINDEISVPAKMVPSFVRDICRYAQYLENQAPNIVNRNEMPSKAWWDNSPIHLGAILLQEIDMCKGGPADTWEPLKEDE